MESLLVSSTNREELSEAVAWVAEGHPMPSDVDWSKILRELVGLEINSDLRDRAIRRAVREATVSEIDTAKVVFNLDAIPNASEIRNSLELLRGECPGGRIAQLDASALRRATARDDRVLEYLCLAVGISLNDVRDWFQGIESSRRPEALQPFVDYIRKLTNGEITPPISGAVPARAVELIRNPVGLAGIDDFLDQGIRYEELLLQRLVGGPWLAHKNTTSNFPNAVAADLLSGLLAEGGIDFRRATTVGGTASQKDLQELSGIPKKQIGLVCLAKSGVPVFAVAFSSARDGGTARANGDGLLQIPNDAIPVALVLTGLGWSDRGETDRLAKKFEGRLYTEKTVHSLVALVAGATA